jgi:hypothetical protein
MKQQHMNKSDPMQGSVYREWTLEGCDAISVRQGRSGPLMDSDVNTNVVK